jgi:hypothetical protein
MSRWQIQFVTISPRDLNGVWEVGVSEAYIKCLRNQGHETPLVRILLVGQSLEHPISIFEGWSRPEKEDCYVYVGNPESDYRSATIQTPAPPNSLFLVFILPDGTIDHWTWRSRAPGSTIIPEDVKGKLIWQRAQPPPN